MTHAFKKRTWPPGRPLDSLTNEPIQMEGTVSAWTVSEADFPWTGSDIEKLRFLVRYAVLAPSSRNAQPWLWKEEGSALELYSHPKRELKVVDPNGRQATIGCGAALLHLQVAIRHFGYEPKIERFPDPENPRYLARVELGTPCVAGTANEVLFGAILTRHTNRGLFDSQAVPATILKAIQTEVDDDRVWLQFLERQEERESLVNLIVEGDLEQWNDHKFRHEMADWISQNQPHRQDGMPAKAMGFNGAESHLLPVAMRQPLIARLINLREVQTDRDWLLAGGAPVLGVLGTPTANDNERDWLAVGEMLGRVLLRAASVGLSASFFNSPAEVPRLWPRLFRILGREGFVHLIFRLGHAMESTMPTPRHSAQEVIVK